jgi:hypothetical protein
MDAVAIMLAAASLGVDYGWQRAGDGELEYIIQIEPSLLDVLRLGQEISSQIHPAAKGVKRFRIRVGSGEVPKEGAESAKIEAAGGAVKAKTAAPPPTPQRAAGDRTSPFPLPSRVTDRSSPPPSSSNTSEAGSPAPADGAKPSAAKADRAAAPQELRVEPPGAPLARWPERHQREAPGAAVVEPERLSPALDSPAKAAAASSLSDQPKILEPPPPDPTGARWGRLSPPPELGLSTQPPARADTARPLADTAESPSSVSPPVQPPTHRSAEAPHTSAASGIIPPPQAAVTPLDDHRKPWLPLTLTTLALFASLGGNVYLGWVAWGLYWRHRRLAERTRATVPSSA